MFATFAALVFLMGGGSRYDIDSVGPLRGASAVVLAVAIWWQTRVTFETIKWPVLLLCLLATWMALQLIPLPHGTWSNLPGRALIDEVGHEMGLADISRPATFSPMRTWNSLGSLIVPMTALFLLALLDDKGWRDVRTAIIIGGVTSALLGMAQITLRDAPGLYLYAITNGESAVGLFSNRNHNALFLNIAMLFVLFGISQARIHGDKSKMALHAFCIIVLALGVVVNSSRFGLGLFALVVAVAAAKVIWSPGKKGGKGNRSLKDWLVGGSIALVSIALLAVFAITDRIPALGRLFAQQFDDDQRVETFAIMAQLAQDHMLLGVGFGAFEHAYRTVEPDDLLMATYLNNAHNDWLQIIIEGGIPAVLLLFALLIFLGKQLRRHISERGVSKRSVRDGAWLGGLTLLMIGLHSFVDYPLRTPIIMLIAAVSVGAIARRGAKETR